MKKILILALTLIVFYSCKKIEYIEPHELVGTWKSYNTEIDTFLTFSHPYSGNFITKINNDTIEMRYITWIAIEDSLYYSVRYDYNHMNNVHYEDKYKIEYDTLKFGNKKFSKIQ